MSAADKPATITVYCEGPPDNDGNPTHERFDIIPYVRHVVQPAGRAMWLPGADISEDGRVERRYKQAHANEKLRWRCPRCGLDEQRRSGLLNDVMERLYAADVAEISARALIGYCWPS